jgi:hypothetical protein
MMLVRRAAKIAIAKKAEHIEKIDLAVAFERYAHLSAGKDLNPFLIENFSMKD